MDKISKKEKYPEMKKFHGSIVALVTPFINGNIDWAAFEKLVEFHIQEGSHAIVPCGTTGESATLVKGEHIAVIEKCVQIVNGRLPVIAGTGSNNTATAIETTLAAQELGADASLSVVPYYNKPSQDGMYHHFKTIHDNTNIPLILYNVPGRTVVEISCDTVAKLAQLPRVIGIKDASTDIGRATELRRKCGDDFILLSGDDPSAAGYLAQGGHGCISVSANVAPKLSAQMQEAWLAQDYARFANLRDQLYPLHGALFCENSPAPTKYALSKLGLCRDEVRMPLSAASAPGRQIVDAAMAQVLDA